MLDPHVYIRNIPAWVWVALVFLGVLYVVPEARQVFVEFTRWMARTVIDPMPPPPAPRPQPQPIPNPVPADDCMSKVSGFLERYYSDKASDIELTKKYLAPFVMYLNKGRVSQEQIMKDRRESARRCPVERDTVLNGTMSTHASNNTTCDAAYTVRATCRNEGKTMVEDWAVNLVIDFSGSVPQITVLDGAKVK